MPSVCPHPLSLLLLSPDAWHLEAPLRSLGVRAGHGDVEVKQHPGGEHTQHQDAEHRVPVDKAVHDAKHDAVLPGLKYRFLMKITAKIAPFSAYVGVSNSYSHFVL